MINTQYNLNIAEKNGLGSVFAFKRSIIEIRYEGLKRIDRDTNGFNSITKNTTKNPP